MFSLALCTGLWAGTASAATLDYPESAEAGQCFARVVVASKPEIITQSVMVEPERTEQIYTPATYAPSKKRVVMREASVNFKVEPAVYKTVTEQVLIQAAYEEATVIPAEYETQTERVLVSPERVTWKPGKGLLGRGSVSASAVNTTDGAERYTGEVLCRVLEPAVYKSVTTQRLVRPAETVVRVVPAKYKTVS